MIDHKGHKDHQGLYFLFFVFFVSFVVASSSCSLWLGRARAALVLLAVKAALRIAPVWTIRTASRESSTPGPEAAALVEQLTRTVAALGCVRILMSDCLSRSVTVAILARTAGVRATLVIGARRVPGGLDAHAWLECGGSAVPMQRSGDYSRLWVAQ